MSHFSTAQNIYDFVVANYDKHEYSTQTISNILKNTKLWFDGGMLYRVEPTQFSLELIYLIKSPSSPMVCSDSKLVLPTNREVVLERGSDVCVLESLTGSLYCGGMESSQLGYTEERAGQRCRDVLDKALRVDAAFITSLVMGYLREPIAHMVVMFGKIVIWKVPIYTVGKTSLNHFGPIPYSHFPARLSVKIVSKVDMVFELSAKNIYLQHDLQAMMKLSDIEIRTGTNEVVNISSFLD